MTNEELVTEIKAGRNEKENMTALWQQNEKFVRQKAHRYRFYADPDDLIQEGYIALYDAVQKFNLAAGTKFITFLSYFLDTAMSRYISTQNVIRLPVVEDARIRKYNKAVNEIYTNTGRAPVREEIKAHLGVSDEEIEKIEKNARIRHVASLDKAQLDDDDRYTLEEVLPDDNDDLELVEESIYRKALKETIWKVVDTLPAEQGEVIRQRYEQGMSCKAIEAENGVDWGKVWRIENSALRALRSGRNGRTLRPFLYAEVYTAALHGSGVERFDQTWTSSTERVALGL